jgi:lipopolysaccharide/colanic/teichoic acid biosynthesis glycosyltransferase
MPRNMAIRKAVPKLKEANQNRPGFASFLPGTLFGERLRMEKLRAERADSPLSIVLLSIRRDLAFERDNIQNIVNVIQSRTRATDVIGFVDRRVIGVILPDTDRQGAEEAAARLTEGNNGLFSSAAAGTYPDNLFDTIPEELPPLRFDAFDFASGRFAENFRFRQMVKRGMDIVGSVVGIVLFLPLMAAIAVAIRAGSPGPAIFKQTRLGRNGVPFTFYKFRSMYLNTDDRIHREYTASLIRGDHDQTNQGDVDKPLYKIKSDPRVTRIGRIIRRTSMDELPQFFNVLKGDMSLVGPRPALAYEAEKYEAWHLRRILEVKPGITGLWQAEGRSKTSFDEMVRLDIRYIQDWSLMLDVKILLKTVKVVLECGGAV